MRKRLFDAFSPIFVPNKPIFKAFWGSSSADLRHHRLTMGSKDLLEHHKWSRITFGKKHFRPIFDPVLVLKRPIFKAFWGSPWPESVPPRAHKG